MLHPPTRPQIIVGGRVELTPSKLLNVAMSASEPKQTSVWHTVSGSLRTRLKTSCGCIRRHGVSVQRWNENADVRLAPGYQARSSYRAHRRQERMELTFSGVYS